MNTDKVIRNELKKLLNQVETLSKQVSDSLENDENIVDLANELVKSTVSFTFHLGQLYGVENQLNQQPVKVVQATKAVNVRYHNVRDSRGRFVTKSVQP